VSEQPSGLVRVVVAGATAGAGFLVSDDGLIATCTHILGEAFQDASVSVVFRFGPPGVADEVREARVEPAFSRPAEAEDVAFLRLCDPAPHGVAALALGSSHTSPGGIYRTFGFPEAKPVEGMAGEVQVTGTTLEGGFEVLQLRSNEVSRGFSGAAVWDERGAVVGMVMSVVRPDSLARQSEVSFVRPIEQLTRLCPDLDPRLVPPYRRLEVFEEEHADDYFGRERAGREVVDKLRAHDFVAVVGVSGSGKSSLVRAGLKKSLGQFPVPGLVKRPRCLVVPGSAPMLDFALALASLPGVEPVEVARALGLSAHALDGPEASLRDAGDELARVGPDELALAIRRLAAGGLLVIVDQFERLFDEARDITVRRHFIDTLLATRGDNVKILITLRADFYGLALTEPGIDVLLPDGQLTLSPMTDDELVQAIEEPARRRGRRLEPGLAQRLIADVKGRSGDLPLLEFALAELWTRDVDSGVLQVATYDRLGYEAPDGRAYPGVQGAIAKHAEQLWTDLEPDEQEASRRVFLSVIGAGPASGEGDSLGVSSSRRAWLIELSDAERAVAEKLAGARLLTTGRDHYSNQATIEVAHEALIRAWPLLGQWSTSFRSFVRWRDRELAPLWQRWVTHGRDPELLLPSGMLDEARRCKEQYVDELSPAHVDYIQASFDAEEAHTVQREAELARTKRLNRRLRTLGLGLGVLFMVGAVLTILVVRQTDKTREEARVGASRLLSGEAEARGARDPSLSVLLSLAASNSADIPEARRSLQSQVVRQRHVQRILTGHSGPVGTVAYSPDGRLLAAAGAGGISVWDRRGRAPPVRLDQPTGTVTAISFSQSGRLLAAGGDEGLAVWDTTRPARPRVRRAWRDQAATLAMSPDGRRIVFAGVGATLIVQDVVGGHRETIRVRGDERIDGITITPDSRRAVSVGDGGASVSNLATRARERRFRFSFRVSDKTALALTVDGRTLATTSGTETFLWDMRSGTKLDALSLGVPDLPLAFRPDGDALATTTYGETTSEDSTRIVTYGVGAKGFVNRVSSAGDPEALVVEDRGNASSLAYSPDGRTLASGSTDGTVTLWEPAGADTISDDKLRSIDTVAFNSDGGVLALGGSSREGGKKRGDALSLVDLARRRTFYHTPCAKFAAPRPRTSMWALGGSSCRPTFGVIDPLRHKGERLVTLLPPASDSPRGLFSEGSRFSPDGRLLAERVSPFRPGRLGDGKINLTDQELLVWDPKTPRAPVARLKVAPPSLPSGTPSESFAFSPDGRTLAIGRSYDRPATDVGDDVKVLLWDTRRRMTTATIKLDSFVSSVAFDPSGGMLAVGLEDRVELWRVSDRTRFAVIGDIRGFARQLAFTPDGEQLAVGDTEGVQLWSVEPVATSGVRLSGNQGPGGETSFGGVPFALSPDGRTLAVADGSKAVAVWNLAAETWHRDLCRILDRDFTRGERAQFLPPDQRSEPTCPEG